MEFIDDKSQLIKKPKTALISSRGTGAGGENTNINGLSYEELTNLETECVIESLNKDSKKIVFKNDTEKTVFLFTKQSHLFKCMKDYIDASISKAHGCKNPDECIINFDKKNIFIIEKKFQQVSGSVCEKIQTSNFKIWQYRRTFPTFNIIYIYCLSHWFKENCKAELEYLDYMNVPVFFGNTKTYKEDIISYILSYK